MQRPLLLSQQQVVPPWGGLLWTRVSTDITAEWYMNLASQEFLGGQAPQALCRRSYTCRSITLLISHLEEEEESLERELDRQIQEAITESG